MNAEWPVVKLKNAGVSLIDCDHKTPKAQENGQPYVGIPQLKEGCITLDGARLITEEDFHLWRKKAKPTPNDIILSRRCNPGVTAYVPEGLEIALGQNLVLLRSDGKHLYPPFLRWLVQGQSWWSQIGKFINVGAVFDSLKCVDIPNFEIKLPPIKSQKKIADILGTIDSKIQLNRQINRTLEQTAQAIFKSWFVDFEPVKAKISAKENGQDPERAAMCTISDKSDAELNQLLADQLSQLTTTAALFPDELVDSDFGLIPRRWEIKKIMDWGTVICGKTPPKKDPCNYGGFIPFIKIPDMHGNVFATTTNDTLSQKGASTQPKKEIPKGSVCVSCIASVGQVVIASENSHSNQQINSIVPENMEHTSFLYFSMRERNMLLHELSSGGSATLNLNTGNFSKIPLLSPSKKLLTKFSKIVWPIFKHILASDRQSQNLTQLRDTLLPKLLSGEITVAETQAKIEEAV